MRDQIGYYPLYEHEKTTLVDSAVRIPRFHFENFALDGIKKCSNGYCAGCVEYKKTQLDTFTMAFENATGLKQM